MPDPSNTSLITFNDWTLRIRESSHPQPRLLVLLHGLTGDEDSMWVFARDLSPQYAVIAPRAHHPAEPFGYSWRSHPSLTVGGSSLEQLLPTAEALIRLIDEYQASAKIDASPERRRRIDVMGFSQGAAMSNLLAFLYPHRIRKVGILAGFVPRGLEELATKRPLEGKPFFVTHGTKDEMVPIAWARDSMALLEQAGAKVTYCEDEVGHKVSATCIRALKDFFAD